MQAASSRWQCPGHSFFLFLGTDFVTRAGPCNACRTHVGPVRGCSNPAKSTPCDFRATYRLHTTTTVHPHTCGPSTTARPYGRHLAVQPLQATRTQPCTHYKPLHTMNLCRHTAKATQGHTQSNTAGRTAGIRTRNLPSEHCCVCEVKMGVRLLAHV